MKARRRIVTAAVTLFLAIAIGHFMQSGEVFEKRYPQAKRNVETVALSLMSVHAETLPTDPLYREMPVTPAAALPVLSMRALTPAAPTPVSVTSDAELGLSSFGLPCAPTLTLTPSLAGMVQLDVAAPCRPFTSLTVHHGDLSFQALTDHMGHLSIEVPAFATSSDIKVAFEDGLALEAQVSVPDADDYDRIAFEWQGAKPVMLHAHEFGAAIGDFGHVHKAAARTPRFAIEGRGGFLTHLGRADLPNARQVQVYSFPRATALGAGDIELRVTAPVMWESCGQRLPAKIHRRIGDAPAAVSRIAVTMPDCSAVGSQIELKNLLPSLTIASR